MIVASADGSVDGATQRAFFFVHGRFIRVDLPAPSASIKLVWRNIATIALSYGIYKAADPACYPSLGGIIVRFHWNGTHLEALDPIPSKDARR